MSNNQEVVTGEQLEQEVTAGTCTCTWLYTCSVFMWEVLLTLAKKINVLFLRLAASVKL